MYMSYGRKPYAEQEDDVFFLREEERYIKASVLQTSPETEEKYKRALWTPMLMMTTSMPPVARRRLRAP
jgi:hypothetical protein